MLMTPRLVVTSIVLLTVPQGPASFAAEGSTLVAVQASLQLPPFNAIEIRNGGHAVLRPGATQRVTLLQGSLDYTRIAVTDGGVLVIDKCRVKCPRGYVLDVEILAPSIGRIAFANGGWIRTLGSFAPQADLAVDVRHGGTIDVRSMAVDRVTASVEQGGRILTVPRGSLSARVEQGGAITYWGNAQVKSSIQHGGVVQKGSPEELNLPFAETGLRALSPVSPIHNRRH